MLVDHDVWPPIIEIISRHVLVDYVRRGMIIGIISRAQARFPSGDRNNGAGGLGEN